MLKPMAPFLGPSRQRLLKMLASSRVRLPITLGQYEPQATVFKSGERYQLALLKPDHAAAEKAAQAALASGEDFMPEHGWAFMGPGQVLVSETSLEKFRTAISQLEWPFGGADE